jgi:hypothetical protein
MSSIQSKVDIGQFHLGGVIPKGISSEYPEISLGYLVRETRIEKHQRRFYRTFFFFFPFHGKGVVTLFPMALMSVLKDTLFYIYIYILPLWCFQELLDVCFEKSYYRIL